MNDGTKKTGKEPADDFEMPDFDAPDFGTPEFETPKQGGAPDFEAPDFEAPPFEPAATEGFGASGFDPASIAPESAPSAEPGGGAATDEAMAALMAERDELREKLMRALAEAENVRRRAERDKKDAETFGGVKLARDLLSVHDNLSRALAAASDAEREAAATLIEGVELTQKELLSAFAKHKVEPVVPEPGEKFDPNLHQAMFEAPVPGAEPGTVIEVMQAGFTMSGRLLRPALVGVAKAG